MSVTISADKYPVLASGAGISGKRICLYVNYGGTGTPTSDAPHWTVVGGVTESSLNVSLNTSMASTKELNYWQSGAITGKSADVSCTIMAKRDDEGILAIEKFVLDDTITSAKQALQFAWVDLDTKDYIVMNALVTSWETTANAEDFVQKSMSASVIGALEEKTNFA